MRKGQIFHHTSLMVWLSHFFPMSKPGLQTVVCSQKALRGMEPIRTIMAESSCKTFCFISRIENKKAVNRINCRAMEFGCLHLASQIWVKQDQPAKYDAKLSQSHNKQL